MKAPPNGRYREGIIQFRKYKRRFEKLKGRLERKIAAGTFYRLPLGTRRYLIRRYHRLKTRLERLGVRLLKLGGIAALSLAFAASPTHAGAPNPLELSALDGSNGFVINGIDSDDFSGYSVSSAGDVNGNGFDDLIIGAYRANSFAGVTYVVFGQAGGFEPSLELSSLNGSNGFNINGIETGDYSGASVSGAGDVNGDGFDDLIIGALDAVPGGNTYAGESYVVFGKAGGFGPSLELRSLDGSNGFVIVGIDISDYSGASVSSAGDVNGDGFDDLIIGGLGADPGGNGLAGESYVVYGKAGGFGASLELSSLNGSNGFVMNGIDIRDYAGISVSSAGDVNGDGFDDLIIGASGADPGGKDFAGESYVVYGRAGGFGAVLELSTLNGSNGFVINGIDSDDYSGRSVSGAGDVNGDGFDDLIIAAYRADSSGRSEAGESYLVFGKAGGFGASLELSSLDGSNGFNINGIDTNDYSGRSVSSAGDVNGDGFDDLIIGAYLADPGDRSGAGESYLVFGKAGGFEASLELSTLNGSNGFVINGIDSFDTSGTSVSSAGDVNGDGFDDLIIGAPRADPDDRSGAGESYLVFGGNFTGGLQNQTITFDPIGATTYRTDRITLSGTASSGLPVTFTVVSGPGLLNPDNSLSLTDPGIVTVRTSQAGNAEFHSAPNVERSFTVTQQSTGGASLLEAGNAKFVNDGTFFDGNTYNGFELAGDTGTFSSIAGEITRISFLDRDGDLMFAEFGSDDPNTVLIITFEEFMSTSAASPYIQPTTVYAQGHPSFEIQNSTTLTFVSFFSLGNDVLRVDGSLIKSDTFDDDVNGVAEIQSLTISDGSTAIGGINAANANFTGSDSVLGIDAPDVSVGVFLLVGDLTPSGTAMPRLRISPESTIDGLLITGGDLAEAIGDFQIDTTGVVYPFPITATDGQRSISNAPLRPDLGDGSLPPVTNTFVTNPDDFFVTDGLNVSGP